MIKIDNWEELSKVKSDTHFLKINLEYGGGWIHPKNEENKFQDSHYLSTHTFYDECYKGHTKLLQSCGFNVELANWDE